MYGKLMHSKLMHSNINMWMKARLLPVLLTLCVVMPAAGCTLPVPLPTQLPVEIPGVPRDLSELQGLLGEWGIPDLSSLADVPGLEVLGDLQTPAGAIAFQGPLDLALSAGQSIPGTDIRFVRAESGADAAQFEIAQLSAPRRLGDSLDFDGAWPGIGGVSYHLRLRVYQIGNGQVRAAGVHRVIIEQIAPQAAAVNLEADGHSLTFPHTVTSNAGQHFPGMTLGYSGQDDRGAVLVGLPDGEYPYRKLGDSVEWAGRLTPQIPVVYHLRLLYYQEANATVGGVAIISLPGP
jgi:hypothetical protein